MNILIMRALILLMLSAGLVSCVPKPHIAFVRPEVSGVILDDGRPVLGVELFLSKAAVVDQPCEYFGERINVSLEGRFSWPSIQERLLFDSLIDPVELRSNFTVLCIRHPTKGRLVGAMLFTNQKVPVSLLLNCDVAHPGSSRGFAGPNFTLTSSGHAHNCEVSRAN
jgi:hypothetical protein